ncbi:MAG: transposase [Deltaproteobacteria bacterium]|jgi:hypothetical protein|nr:transposase [Deltaproteobacteria bacterium]
MSTPKQKPREAPVVSPQDRKASETPVFSPPDRKGRDPLFDFLLDLKDRETSVFSLADWKASQAPVSIPELLKELNEYGVGPPDEKVPEADVCAPADPATLPDPREILRKYHDQAEYVGTLADADPVRFIGATVGDDGRYTLRPQHESVYADICATVKHITDEDVRIRYYDRLCDKLELKAKGLKKAAVDAGLLQLGDLLLEYQRTLKAMDNPVVLPSTWSRRHTKAHARSWHSLIRTDVLDKLNCDALDVLYDGDGTKGRPRHSARVMLGITFVQKLEELTDDEASLRLASDGFLQVDLGLEPFSDKTYVCPRSIRRFRNEIEARGLTDEVFGPMDKAIDEKYGPDNSVLRGDTFNVKSNMKKLNRLMLMFRAMQKALKEAERRDPELSRLIPQAIRARYAADKNPVSVFSMVRREGTERFMNRTADDMFSLLQTPGKKSGGPVELKSWHDLERVFNDQCEIVPVHKSRRRKPKTWGIKPRARLKPKDEVAATAMQNPSDPDATYNHFKGEGYTVPVLENVPPEVRPGVLRGISLILFMTVMPAHLHDTECFALFMDVINSLPTKVLMLLLDGAFGSQKNFEFALEHGVELLSLVCSSTPGAVKSVLRSFGIPLDSFEKDSEGKILACPCGQKATTTFRDNKDGRAFTARFCRGTCLGCERSAECPVSILKTRAVLHYTKNEMGLAIRRTWQRSDWFKKNYRPRSGVEATIQKLKKLLLRYGKLTVRGMQKIRHSIALGLRVENYNRVVRYRQNLDKLAEKEIERRKGLETGEKAGQDCLGGGRKKGRRRGATPTARRPGRVASAGCRSTPSGASPFTGEHAP